MDKEYNYVGYRSLPLALVKRTHQRLEPKANQIQEKKEIPLSEGHLIGSTQNFGQFQAQNL